MGWTLVSWSTWDFSETKDNSHKSSTFDATFSVGYPKNIISKFSVEPFWMEDSKLLFPGYDFRKIARDRFLYSRNDQKLV